MMKELELAYENIGKCTGYENSKTDTQYGITVDEKYKTVIVAFQGSGSKMDWMQNFTFWKKPYKEMDKLFFVHWGLFNKYKSVENELWSKLTPYVTPDWKIRGYGFSQGATLATFFHEDAVFRYPDLDIKTYAFAPAKGFSFWNSKFLKTRFDKLITIKNVNDVVPKVPFWFMGFKHYGEVVKLGKRKFTFPWNWYKEHMGYKALL